MTERCPWSVGGWCRWLWWGIVMGCPSAGDMDGPGFVVTGLSYNNVAALRPSRLRDSIKEGSAVGQSVKRTSPG